MGSLSVIIALIIIVVLHEAGHFLAARAVGIRATKFYLFFPPAAITWQRGDVEYGIGWLPLGGFVKLPGMFQPEPAAVALQLDREVRELAAGLVHARSRDKVEAALKDVRDARDADALTAPLLALSTELAAAAETQGQAPPTGPFEGLSGSMWHARVERVRSRITGLVDDAHPRAFWRASLWRRMVVIFAGPLVNVVLAFAIVWVVLMLFVPRYDAHAGFEIAAVTPRTSAATAGVHEGDRIVRWNGTNVEHMTIDPFLKLQKASRGKPIDLVVRRSGSTTKSFHLVPHHVAGSGTKRKLVGIASQSAGGRIGWIRTNPWTAGRATAQGLWHTTTAQLHAVARLVHAEDRRQVHSVVGIVQAGDEIPSVVDFALFAATISLVIAVMNLLPLLPLDGGHLLFGLLEFLRRGRPVSRVGFERYSVVGIAMMLMLFAIGLNNDLGHLVGG